MLLDRKSKNSKFKNESPTGTRSEKKDVEVLFEEIFGNKDILQLPVKEVTITLEDLKKFKVIE